MDKITIKEYELLMKAVSLKKVDKSYDLHAQAFLNFSVQAEKRAGKNKTKPVYNRFEKFFDYEKEVNKVLGKTNENNKFLEISKKIKEKGG